MNERGAVIAGFLRGAGWADVRTEVLAGDASARRYLRLVGHGTTAVLMDAPPVRCGSIAPFLRVSSHLAGLGISAPRILASDTVEGLILLEDLGDDSFLRVMDGYVAVEEILYGAALDTVVAFQAGSPPAELPVWDAAHMTELLRPAFSESLGGEGRFDHWRDALVDSLAALDTGPRVFCHRDFHAGNLFWLPNRHGIARVGVIDHQDAFVGHPAYDLVSLITDARRDLAPGLAEDLSRHWLDLTGGSDARLRADLPLLVIQRNLRIHGVLTRLTRTGKPQYAAFLPRVRRHLAPALAAVPALAPLAGEVLP
jgi:aminoglycoside/choline kinase family phosphotransferase